MKKVLHKIKRRLRIISFTDAIYDFCYDVRLGVETRKTDRLLDNQQLHFNYMPTSYLIINRLFKKYKFQPEDHLVDFGCGKGRVVLLAANHSCPIVTGVEINPNMIRIAEKNVEILLSKKNKNTTILLKSEDASKMKISSDMNKFFFFNPFHLKIFIYTINQISKSVQEHPRKILLFFLWPQESTINFMETLEDYKTVESYDDGKYKYFVYEYKFH